jgi:Uma2 family endonuclease
MTISGFHEREGHFDGRVGRPPSLTQAADGLPRRGFTNRDIERMIEAGVIDTDEFFELIKGEIVPMNAEYDRHARARQKLTRIFMRALGDEWFVATEGSLFLADDTEFKPDLHIFSAAMKTEDVRGADVLLAVELASTTQKKDFEIKAPIYAEHGVRELWIIDLDAKTGLVCTRIESGAFVHGRAVGPSDKLSPGAFPCVSLTINDLF